MLVPVTSLSDDEGDLITPARVVPWVRSGSELSGEKPEPVAKRQKLQRKALSFADDLLEHLLEKTRAIVQSKCRCSQSKVPRNCYVPFRDSDQFQRLTAHIRRLREMDKMELDKEARKQTLVLGCLNHFGVHFHETTAC